jgi:hypothetical protein
MKAVAGLGAELGEFGAQAVLVANENDFLNEGKPSEGFDCGGGREVGSMVPTHGVERDSHPEIRPELAFGGDAEDLTTAVEAGLRIHAVPEVTGTGFLIDSELDCGAAIGSAAGALLHFRNFTFWDGHG